MNYSVRVTCPPELRREGVVEALCLVRHLLQLFILPSEISLRRERHAERQTRKHDLKNHRHGVAR